MHQIGRERERERARAMKSGAEEDKSLRWREGGEWRTCRGFKRGEMNSAEKESGVGMESCRSQGERDSAGGRFMEGTYPEIYMNLWQEMRQMQGGDDGGKEVRGVGTGRAAGLQFLWLGDAAWESLVLMVMDAEAGGMGSGADGW